MPDDQQGQAAHDYAQAFLDRKNTDPPPVAATPAATPVPSPAITAPPATADFAQRFLDRNKNPAAPAKIEQPPEPTGSVLTRSILGSGFRKSLESVIPEAGKSDSWMSRFLSTGYKDLPVGFMDFITSPAGIGLVALHTVPQTRGIAALADIGITAYAGKQVADASKAFSADRSPENAAHLVSALAGVAGGLKAAKEANASSFQAGKEAFASAVDKRAAQEVGRKQTVQDLRETAPFTEEGDAPPTATGVLGAKTAKLSKIADPTGDSAIKTFWNKSLDTLHQIPVLGDVARAVIRPPAPELIKISQDLVGDRLEFEAGVKFEVNSALHVIDKVVPPEDLTVFKESPDGKIEPSNKLAAVIQGTVSPEEAKLSPEATKAAEVYRKLNVQSANLLKKFYGDDLELADPDSYLTQIWEMPKDRGLDTTNGRAAYGMMRDRFLKKKTFEDYETGIAAGWKPKYNNINDIIRVRWNYISRAIANQRFANTLHEMGAVATKAQKDALGLDNWVELNDVPALYKAAYESTEQFTKQVRGEDVKVERSYYRYQPVYAHPQMALAAKAVFARGLQSPTAIALENMRSVGKRLNLLGSIFHNWAITEQSQGLTAGSKGVMAGLKQWWFTDPEVYKGARTGIAEVTGRGPKDDMPIFRLNDEVVRDSLAHGMRPEIPDAELATRSFLRSLGADGPTWKRAVTAPIRAVGHITHVLDRSLWDFYLPANMVHSYELGVSSALERLGEHNALPPANQSAPRSLDALMGTLDKIDLREGLTGKSENAQVRAVKRAVADQINDAYGAISWQKMLVHPSVARMASWLMLAPGWKLANFRVYTQAFEGALGWEMAKNYAIGAGLTWFISMQAGNWITSSLFKNKDKDGKQQAHFTWDNPGSPFKIGKFDTGLTSNSFAIAAGYKPNGSEQYINWGKGLVDPFHAASDPFAWGMGALSSPLQALGTALYGVDPVTGYQYINHYDTKTKQNLDRVEILANSLLPFAWKEPLKAIEDKRFNQIYPMPGAASTLFSVAGLPTRQGINYDKAKQAFISAMREGDPEAGMMILKYAQASNLKASVIVQEWNKYQATERKKDQPMPQVFTITGQEKK